MKRLTEWNREIERSATMRAQNTFNPEGAQSQKAEMASRAALIARLRQVRATGRILLELADEATAKNLPDILTVSG